MVRLVIWDAIVPIMMVHASLQVAATMDDQRKTQLHALQRQVRLPICWTTFHWQSSRQAMSVYPCGRFLYTLALYFVEYFINHPERSPHSLKRVSQAETMTIYVVCCYLSVYGVPECLHGHFGKIKLFKIFPTRQTISAWKSMVQGHSRLKPEIGKYKINFGRSY